jgi:PhnB protein
MTVNTGTAASTIELAPYIFFYGRCEEALNFYKAILGGSYEMQRVSESPMAAQSPPEAQNRVMHSVFTASGIKFMAGDGMDVKAIDPDEGNISLGLSFTDTARGKEVFDALSAGGKVKMPLGDAFWGGKFGMLDDKFGIEWMITTP